MRSTIDREISNEGLLKVISTFAHHESGYIPDKYIEVLHKLSERFKLAIVIDIWAPKNTWLRLFEKLRISRLFLASSFSSDHGTPNRTPMLILLSGRLDKLFVKI